MEENDIKEKIRDYAIIEKIKIIGGLETTVIEINDTHYFALLLDASSKRDDIQGNWHLINNEIEKLTEKYGVNLIKKDKEVIGYYYHSYQVTNKNSPAGKPRQSYAEFTKELNYDFLALILILCKEIEEKSNTAYTAAILKGFYDNFLVSKFPNFEDWMVNILLKIDDGTYNVTPHQGPVDRELMRVKLFQFEKSKLFKNYPTQKSSSEYMRMVREYLMGKDAYNFTNIFLNQRFQEYWEEFGLSYIILAEMYKTKYPVLIFD
jgi:hypothetical protein